MAKKLVPANTPNDGLPDNWKPVEESASAAPQAPPAAFASASPQFAASIPLSSQLTPDIMPTRYPAGVGGYRIFPPPPSANPLINSAIKSTIDNTPCCATPTITEIDRAKVICGNYTATGADGGQLLTFQCPALGPFPLLASGLGCYAGGGTLEVTLTVPSGGLNIGDTVLVSVLVNSPGLLTAVFDSLSNSFAFIFNLYRSLDGGFAAAYFVLTAPVAGGTIYTVSITGAGSSVAGEATVQLWRNLGAPQLSEVVTILGTVPYEILTPSITTVAPRALIATCGYSTNNISSGWVIATPSIINPPNPSLFPEPQAYWYNGVTSVVPAGSYGVTFTSTTGPSIYEGAIIPFSILP